jgi:hypothetical protein
MRHWLPAALLLQAVLALPPAATSRHERVLTIRQDPLVIPATPTITSYGRSSGVICSKLADRSPDYVPLFPERWFSVPELPGYSCLTVR